MTCLTGLGSISYNLTMIFSPILRTAEDELSTADSPNTANFWRVKGAVPTRPGTLDKSSTTNLINSALRSRLLGFCLAVLGRGSMRASCRTFVLTTLAHGVWLYLYLEYSIMLKTVWYFMLCTCYETHPSKASHMHEIFSFHMLQLHFYRAFVCTLILRKECEICLLCYIFGNRRKYMSLVCVVRYMWSNSSLAVPI